MSRLSPDRLIVRSLTSAPPRNAPRVSVYLDESSITGCRYMAIGGLWIPDTCEPALRAAIQTVRTSHGMKAHGEFKWTKTSGSSTKPAYLGAIDAFFANPDCRFNAMVIDTRNPGRNRGEDEERDFYTSVHWLLRLRIERGSVYRLVLDHRSDKRKDRLSELREVLDNAVKLEHRITHRTMREVIARDSKDEPLIQLADLLLGAVCHHFNGCHRVAGASAGKAQTAAYIASKARFRGGIISMTARSERKFNVWRWES